MPGFEGLAAEDAEVGRDGPKDVVVRDMEIFSSLRTRSECIDSLTERAGLVNCALESFDREYRAELPMGTYRSAIGGRDQAHAGSSNDGELHVAELE